MSRAAVEDQGLRPSRGRMPGPLGVRLSTLDRSQWGWIWWYCTGPRLGLKLTLARATGLGYDQKHIEMKTSVPKSGPWRLNLPRPVLGGDG